MVNDRSANRQRRVARWLVFLLLLWPLQFFGHIYADSFEDRRVRAGARILRPLLAADLALEAKIKANNGLNVWLIGNNSALSKEISEVIAPKSDPSHAQIRGTVIRISTYANLSMSKSAQAAIPIGVFFTQTPSEQEFAAWLAWGKMHQVLLFSPFEGHVERGMTAGISVQARVQPLLSTQGMKSINLQLKPFFLRVAKVVP